MNRRTFVKTLPAVTMLAGSVSALAAEAPATEEIKEIALLKPETEGGKSVLAALAARRTTRSIKPDPLPPQVLANLLWAAFGVNRDRGPFNQQGRTAASASNSQEMDLYVALAGGIYLYDAPANSLKPVVAGDHRARSSGRGRGRGAATAPVNLIFVVDLAKYARAPLQEPRLKDPEFQKLYYGVATGLIAGNVYLFAAAHGLAAWFHNCDLDGLAGVLKLRSDQRVLFAQTVGYPA